jgi:hypothetical protein
MDASTPSRATPIPTSRCTSDSAAVSPKKGSLCALALDSALTTLPQTLALASLPKEDSEPALRFILTNVFFPAREDSFFSYTVTDEEVSLILEEKYLSSLPSDTLAVAPARYRAIQVYEGPEAINMTGYISLLSGGITQEGINVIYLSTYNTDLLLVEQSKLDEALKCLRRRLDEFVQSPDETPASFLSHSPTASIQTPPHTPPHTIPHINVSSPSSFSSIGPTACRRMTLTPLPKTLSIAFFPRKDVPKCAYSLLKPFLSDLSFYSMTLTAAEVSLILDEEVLSLFPKDLIQVHSSKWRCIQVDFGSMGFTETGAVSLLADILAKKEVSIFYLSTFSTDFTLVEAPQLESAITIVEYALSQERSSK